MVPIHLGDVYQLHTFVLNMTILVFFVVAQDLLKTGHFTQMSLQTDEDEHSIEMHLPYVFKIMEKYAQNAISMPLL
jgi:predicted class III extradiol MEMO1 family dioxygenase